MSDVAQTGTLSMQEIVVDAVGDLLSYAVAAFNGAQQSRGLPELSEKGLNAHFKAVGLFVFRRNGTLAVYTSAVRVLNAAALALVDLSEGGAMSLAEARKEIVSRFSRGFATDSRNYDLAFNLLKGRLAAAMAASQG